MRRRGALLRRPPAAAPSFPHPEPSDPEPVARIRSPPPVRSKPLDPDPMAENQTYPFGLYLLLKSPPTITELTHGPG